MIDGTANTEPAEVRDPSRWVLVFAAEPGEVPAGRRVAQVLKYAKRVHGLRCIEASSTTPDEQRERLQAEVIELRTALAKATRPRKVIA